MDKFGFNPEYAKSVSQEDFVNHFKNKEPFNSIDLKAKYYELTGKKEEKVKPVAKKEEELPD